MLVRIFGWDFFPLCSWAQQHMPPPKGRIRQRDMALCIDQKAGFPASGAMERLLAWFWCALYDPQVAAQFFVSQRPSKRANPGRLNACTWHPSCRADGYALWLQVYREMRTTPKAHMESNSPFSFLASRSARWLVAAPPPLSLSASHSRNHALRTQTNPPNRRQRRISRFLERKRWP